MATYVVGDIHGCYDEWMELNNRILAEDPSARFILLGDIIDRGHKSYEMILWMLTNVDNTSPDSRYRMVLGNHEFEKIDWWKGNREAWKKGLRPSDRYGFDKVLQKHKLPVEAIDEIIGAFSKLPLEIWEVVEGRTFAIAHGDVLPRERVKAPFVVRPETLSYEQKDFIVWNRNYGAAPVDADVVNGHTPTVLLLEEGVFATKGVCYHSWNRHIVDCGMVYESDHPEANLAALRLEDMEEIYLYEGRALKAKKTMEKTRGEMEELFGGIIP